MRTRHEQAATHGGRFRSRYESQAAAQHLRRTAKGVSRATRRLRDHNGQQLAYIYFKGEPGRRSAAKLLTKDEARRIKWFLS
jgi:hypothetical protein